MVSMSSRHFSRVLTSSARAYLMTCLHLAMKPAMVLGLACSTSVWLLISLVTSLWLAPPCACSEASSHFFQASQHRSMSSKTGSLVAGEMASMSAFLGDGVVQHACSRAVAGCDGDLGGSGAPAWMFVGNASVGSQIWFQGASGDVFDSFGVVDQARGQAIQPFDIKGWATNVISHRPSSVRFGGSLRSLSQWNGSRSKTV